MQYIISEFPSREAIGCTPTMHIYAPPGYMRENGKVVWDGSSLSDGPEWGEDSTKAYRFHSHSSAARVLSKCGQRARIVTLKLLNDKARL